MFGTGSCDHDGQCPGGGPSRRQKAEPLPAKRTGPRACRLHDRGASAARYPLNDVLPHLPGGQRARRLRFSRNGGDGSARGDAVSGIRRDQRCDHEVQLALRKNAMPMSPLAPISSAVADRRSATDVQPRWQEPTYVEGADSGDWGRRRRLQFTDRLELPRCSCPV
jgi:hypothetical protein